MCMCECVNVQVSVHTLMIGLRFTQVTQRKLSEEKKNILKHILCQDLS